MQTSLVFGGCIMFTTPGYLWKQSSLHRVGNGLICYSCNKEGVVYRGECLLCKAKGKSSIYIGESGRSAYFRGKQHLKAISKPEDHETTNAFAKHLMEHHAGENNPKPFQMSIIDTYRRPLQRQIREGIEIYRCNSEIPMNSKLNHYQPGVRRIAFTNSLE